LSPVFWPLTQENPGRCTGDHPTIRHYLSEKHCEHRAFLRRTAILYREADIINPDTLEEGLSSLMLYAAGSEYLHIFHESVPRSHAPHMAVELTDIRRKLLYTLVTEKYRFHLQEILNDS